MATIYGEGDPGNVARLLSSIDRGRFLWVGDGDNRKSLIHREDAARACVRAALAGVQTSATFNVSAPPCTMREIVRTACELLGRRPPRLHIPGSLALPFARLGAAMTLGKWRIDDTLRKWLSDDVYPAGRIREALRFEASVSLSEGLGREVAWYRNKAR
jgi:nucleoside-diphosphate-sugar epimerase